MGKRIDTKHGWRRSVLLKVMAVSLGALLASGAAQGQMPTVPQELEAKIASHPHVRQLTTWGSRPDWSGDSRHLLFVSKEYGDVFELDVVTGRMRPMTFHFPHKGFFRAYYLANGDILLTGARDWQPESRRFGRYFDSEVWLMKADLSAPPVPLGIFNFEGIAVDRNSMRIAWSAPPQRDPVRRTDRQMFSTPDGFRTDRNQIWVGEISLAGGKPEVINRRVVADCGDRASKLNAMLAERHLHCGMLEPQNFVPGPGDRLTATTVGVPDGKVMTGLDPAMRIDAITIALGTGDTTQLSRTPPYNEPEGIFPDGRNTMVEHTSAPMDVETTEKIDLWQLATDGSGKMRRVTRYNLIDPRLKSNQPVISPDGRWMAFDVSTGEIERAVPGQGVGLFLMDLRAAGFTSAAPAPRRPKRGRR
jgi:hypothetical protein